MVNDSLGHRIGDELRVLVARRLEQCVRSHDNVARLGGDVFAILVKDLRGVGEATTIAERVQKALSAPFSINGHDIFVSCSIGIAVNSGAYDKPDEILRDADTAMCRAKAQGKARFEVFNPAMHLQALRELDCPYGQGFIISKPVDRKGAESLLALIQKVALTHPRKRVARTRSARCTLCSARRFIRS